MSRALLPPDLVTVGIAWALDDVTTWRRRRGLT
jgi:hypothetical protein